MILAAVGAIGPHWSLFYSANEIANLSPPAESAFGHGGVDSQRLHGPAPALLCRIGLQHITGLCCVRFQQRQVGALSPTRLPVELLAVNSDCAKD